MVAFLLFCSLPTLRRTIDIPTWARVNKLLHRRPERGVVSRLETAGARQGIEPMKSWCAACNEGGRAETTLLVLRPESTDTDAYRSRGRELVIRFHVA
jgi:hypothetical protein